MRWEDVKKTPEGATIELKGFLFPTSDGGWILSSEPGLKSCCVGSIHKQASQITLLGDFSGCSRHKPTEVRGILQCEEGRYLLIDGESVHKETFPLWTMVIILSCLVLIGCRSVRNRLF